MVLVGKKAPQFVSSVVNGNEIIKDFCLNQFIGKKHVVLANLKFYFCLSIRTTCFSRKIK